MSALLLVALLQTATAAAAPVEQASTDDCAIIVAVGKAQLKWGARSPPAYAFYPEWDRDGGGVYVETCPWKALGVAPPVIGTPESESGFSITRPEYDVPRQQAWVDIQIFMSKRLPDGKAAPPFLQTMSCSLARHGDRWRIVKCDPTAIT
jgi:hypothetical protein